MDPSTVKKYKWFWAWEDEKEEAWLSEMANRGLHLKEVGFPGVYLFQQGEPANYVYRLDYQSLRSKDRESYLQLFADAGWEHVGDMAGWVYFRIKAKPGEAPEIYSDAESKMGKYYRVMMYLIIFLPFLIIFKPDPPEQTGAFYVIIDGIYAILMLLYGLALFNLLRRMSQLKSGKS
jgi:hypothetical protein